ncbi:S-methyl-5'-thioinosine phosphorylase [Fusibacter bizertensis]
MRKAIIGGTGVYSAFGTAKSEVILTAYGEVAYDLISLEEVEIIFLARHGKEHQTPPHKINYRANMMALKMLEVDEIYAICAVGSLNDAFEPGEVVLLRDFIDFTKNRVQTYYDGDGTSVAHVEMTYPYCPKLMEKFKNQFKSFGITYKGEAVYVCTEGPRFETAAEIKMYHILGGDVVGMTNVPESVLAKELGMCYSAVGVITNWCTGIEGKNISGHLISKSMNKNKEALTKLFITLLSQPESEGKCKCDQSLIIL